MQFYEGMGNWKRAQITCCESCKCVLVAARSISKDGIGDITNLTQCSELGKKRSFFLNFSQLNVFVFDRKLFKML